MNTQIGRTRKAKAMLRRSPMQIVDYSAEHSTISRGRLELIVRDRTEPEMYLWLLDAQASERGELTGVFIYRGGHHIAVHASDGGPCMFRVVETYPRD